MHMRSHHTAAAAAAAAGSWSSHDFSCSPACSVQAAVLLHAEAEPLSKKGQLASGSLYLFASSVTLSQGRAAVRQIFVVHLQGRGGGEIFDPLAVSQLRKLKVLIKKALPCWLQLS